MSTRIDGPGRRVDWSQAPQATTPCPRNEQVQMAIDELVALAPELSPEVASLLAVNGIPIPARTPPDSSGMLSFLTHQNANRNAAMEPLQSPPPAESYFDDRELAAQIDQMYGPGASTWAAGIDLAMVRLEAAMLAAFTGDGPDAVVRILGADNPHAAELGALIGQITEVMTHEPLDVDLLVGLVEEANWKLLDYLAPEGGPKRDLLETIFREQYGVTEPGTRPYAGQGALGYQVYPPEMPYVPPQPPSNIGTGGAGKMALAVAQSQVGVREATGNNDGIPEQRYADGRREPWCADFVTWCFKQTGCSLPGNQRQLASVQFMEDQLKRGGHFIPNGAQPPQPGDIIFFRDRGANKGSGRHVGIVEKVEGDRVFTIEGNSGDRVARRSYPTSSSRISGYGRTE